MTFGKGCHLHLIDGSAYIFRAYHALPPLTRKSDGLPIGAVSGFCNMLQRYVEDNTGPDAPTHVAVVFDGAEQRNKRRNHDEIRLWAEFLTPGDKRVEPDLTHSLGVSRTPLREAFRALAAEGYITVIPHKGSYVSTISEDEVLDLYSITSVLEGLATRLATPVRRINAERINGPGTDGAQLVAQGEVGNIQNGRR